MSDFPPGVVLPSPTKVGDFSEENDPVHLSEALGVGEDDLTFDNKRSHDQAFDSADESDSKRMKGEDGMSLAAKKINNEQWEAMFERLKLYKERHGDCLVPKRYIEDPKLGTWVETQRVQYKRLEKEIDEASGEERVAPNKRLNQERLEKLKSIGFAWSAKNVRKPKALPLSEASRAVANAARVQKEQTKSERGSRYNEIPWDEMYNRLVLFKEKYGHCLVPRKFEEDPKLATWVETQRALWNRDYRKAAPVATENASASSASSSDNLGVEKPAGGTAEEAVELAATIEEAMAHGEPNVAAAAAQVAVPANLYPTGPAASEEAMVGVDNAFEEDAKMAAAIAPKKLTPERKEKLDALGFVWSLRTKRIEDHWDEMFRQLCEYRDKHGDCLVPSRYDVNPKLGKWVETQRYEYTKMQRAANGVTVEAKVEEAEDAGAKQRPAIPNPRLTEERLRRLESIGFQFKVKHKMKRYYDKQWDQMFERLLKFRDENGHCMVPKRYAADVKLGTWVHTQRIQYRKMISSKGAASDGGGSVDGTKAMDTMSDAGSEDMVLEKTGSEEEISFRLTDERRKRLEEIGFCWSAREGDKVSTDPSKVTRNSYDDQWDYMFNRLKLYKDTYGNCLVPKRFKDDPKLGTWVDTQRVQYKKMQKKLASQGVQYDGPAVDSGDEGSQPASSSQEKPIVGRLTDERIRRLESLGFVWSLRDDWWKHYEELKAFKEQHGHCNVPARYAQNRRLGIWVSAQRQQYKLVNSALDDPKQRRAAPLTAERVGLLNELGFTWTIRSRDSLGESWNQRLQDLVDFRKAHGHCNVPSRYPPCPELGVWVGTQRTQYRFYMKAKETGEKAPGNSAMNEERIKQLEDLGFNWSLRGGSEGARREAETSMNDSAARIQELVDDDFPSEMV